jgi:hypothetical protein
MNSPQIQINHGYNVICPWAQSGECEDAINSSETFYQICSRCHVGCMKYSDLLRTPVKSGQVDQMGDSQ